MGIVVLGVCCYARCQTKRNAQKNNWREYAFSLLGDGSSFFDDDEKEVEIFKRPANRGALMIFFPENIYNIDYIAYFFNTRKTRVY